MLKVRYGIKMYIQIKHRNYKWYTVLEFETIILTSSTSFSTSLIIWSCVIKMKRFLPVMGTVSVWAMVYSVSARAVAPSKAVKITAFCWCGSFFQWSLRRLKSNFNAFLLTSFIDCNISRKCMLNRFTYSVWKSLMHVSRFLTWNKHKLCEFHYLG